MVKPMASKVNFVAHTPPRNPQEEKLTKKLVKNKIVLLTGQPEKTPRNSDIFEKVKCFYSLMKQSVSIQWLLRQKLKENKRVPFEASWSFCNLSIYILLLESTDVKSKILSLHEFQFVFTNQQEDCVVSVFLSTNQYFQDSTCLGRAFGTTEQHLPHCYDDHCKFKKPTKT